jgi:phospholipid transport system transporter-binding protein
MFRPTLTLTATGARSTYEAGLRAIEAGQQEIDLAQLTVVDSAAVATLVAWKRAAAARGATLSFRNTPASLVSLASLYGADVFLHH